MPQLTVFAGPNGSGKSSIIKRSEFLGAKNVLDADVIAKRISPQDYRQGAISAGREMLQRTQNHIEAGDIFAMETTLSGGWILSAIRAAKQRQFDVVLIYVCVGSPEKSVQRVKERAAQGGHDIPEEDIRRRYGRSLANAQTLLGVVNQAMLYDNSGKVAAKVLEVREGAIVWQAANLPEWAQPIIAKVTSPQ